MNGIFKFVFAAFLFMQLLGCKNYKQLQLEEQIGFELGHTELLNDESGMDEMTGDRFFISIYKLPAGNISKIKGDTSFKKLANPSYFSGTKLEKYLTNDAHYLYKVKKNSDEVQYTIVNPDESYVILAESTNPDDVVFFKNP
jgi:hypothetical protein